MATEENNAQPAFSWNAWGWFGTQLGATLWMLILGVVLLSKDSLAALVNVGGFVVLNAWGLCLWQSRERLSAHAGFQRLLGASSVVIAFVVVVNNSRGSSQPRVPGAWVSTYLPYWVIAVAPALMLLFFLLERQMKRNRE
jgi:hypothetical protein